MPAYYFIAASAPLQRLLARGAGGEILSLEDRLASIRPVGSATPAQLAEFRQGLVEVKRREDLYPANFGQVTVQAGRLFRAELPFPSRLPEGVYDVRTYLLRDGKIVRRGVAALAGRQGRASAPSWPAGPARKASFTASAPS